MAWIESHQSLRDHPKTLLLCEILKSEKPKIIGHLHLFWWWCIEYAANGDLKKFTTNQISKAAEWDGNADDFVTAMRKVRFIDRYKVHDWCEFTLHYNLMLEKRERQRDQVRERVKKWRNANVTQNVTHSNVSVTECNAPTKPNQTKPNHIKKKTVFVKPSFDEVTAYGKTIEFSIDGREFVDYYEARGWRYKTGQPMVDWKAAVRTWKKNNFNQGVPNGSKVPVTTGYKEIRHG